MTDVASIISPITMVIPQTVQHNMAHGTASKTLISY